jgi:opacity protein-like surface antigen
MHDECGRGGLGAEVNGVKRMYASLLVLLTCSSAPPRASAQDDDRVYAGTVAGVATLSADARASTQPGRAEVSLYKPENGPALDVFAGVHAWRYVTVQANYVGNRNDVTLLSSISAADGGRFYEQRRSSSQHAVVGDALLYFRARNDAVRPYLSTGVGVVRFESAAVAGVNSGLVAPDEDITSTRVTLRVAVGIDLAIGDAWSFRYSFSETIGGNPISPRLMPPGERNLMNFQNLFGFLRRF